MTDKSTESCESSLAEWLEHFEITLEPSQVRLLDAYCTQLWKLNRHLNLTRHTTYEQFVARDVIDCLQLSRLIVGNERVLDIGTGGGVPGVVLAILRPDLEMELCESVGKKATAVRSIVEGLDLSIVTHAHRVEQMLEEKRYDTLVARAIGPLWKILTWVQPHWASIGRLLLVKGPRWVQERGEARHRGLLRGLELRRVATYEMPGRDAEGVVLSVKAAGGTKPA